MNLVVGNEYYWLTEAEFQALPNIFEGDEYVKGPDGYYYADINSENLDDDELEYLLENDLANTTYYSKSTQPGQSM